MPGRFFKPSPMLPPTLGIGMRQYAEYVSTYEIYLDKLVALRAHWKVKVKTQEKQTRSAASRGAQVRYEYKLENTKQDKVIRSVAGLTTASIPVERVLVKAVEFPQPVSKKKVTSPDEKKARRRAKKARYAYNRRARKAEQEAKLSALEAKASKNHLATVKAELVSAQIVAKTPEGTGEIKKAVANLVASRVRRPARARRAARAASAPPRPEG